MMHPTKVLHGSVGAVDKFGYHNSRSPLDKQSVIEEVSNFVEATKRKSVMVFTDGSVYDGAVS